jgi:hypothetical protein
MDYYRGIKNSTIVVMLISLIMLFNNYFKNDDENKKVGNVFGKVNDEICELSDVSDWGQYIIIDD